MRALAVVALVLVAGCSYFGAQPEPRQRPPEGELWIDITNRSDESFEILQEGHGDTGGGSWATRAEPCQAFRAGGTMERTWRILVDGKVVLDSEDLPGGVPGGGMQDVLVTLDIDPDGDVSVDGPVVGGGAPEDASRVPGCGEDG